MCMDAGEKADATKTVDLYPGESVLIRCIEPKNYLRPGYYLTRHKLAVSATPSLSEWNGSRWAYIGVSGTDEFDDVELMSGRLQMVGCV